MKYTKERIRKLMEIYENFDTHVSNVVDLTRHRGSLRSIDYISGDALVVTLEDYRCGSYDTEEVRLPLDWLVTDDHDEVKAMIAAEHAAKEREAAERRQAELLKAAQQQEERERAELARLQAKYESNN